MVEIANPTAAPRLIPIPTTINGIAFAPDGTLAFATDADRNAVVVIDMVELEVRPARIPIGHYPSGIAITPDGSLAVVANLADNTASVIELDTHHVRPPIPTDNAPVGVAISPDGGYAFVTNTESNDLTIIDLADSTTSTLAMGNNPVAVAIGPRGPDTTSGPERGPVGVVVNQSDGTVILI